MLGTPFGNVENLLQVGSFPMHHNDSRLGGLTHKHKVKLHLALFFLSSKDFGMSGIRVGVLYTRNQEIRKAVNQLAVFHSCPGPVQHVLSQFLRDRG